MSFILISKQCFEWHIFVPRIIDQTNQTDSLTCVVKIFLLERLKTFSIWYIKVKWDNKKKMTKLKNGTSSRLAPFSWRCSIGRNTFGVMSLGHVLFLLV